MRDRGFSRKPVVVASRGLVGAWLCATLLLGLTAIATKAEPTFDLPDDVRLPLAIAIGAFVGAALCAIFTNVPRGYREAGAEGLGKLVSKSCADLETEALAKVAKNRLSVLGSAREINRDKGRALLLAIIFEALAVAALFWAMLALLY
jgi:hypothetical protein